MYNANANKRKDVGGAAAAPSKAATGKRRRAPQGSENSAGNMVSKGPTYVRRATVIQRNGNQDAHCERHLMLKDRRYAIVGALKRVKRDQMERIICDCGGTVVCNADIATHVVFGSHSRQGECCRGKEATTEAEFLASIATANGGDVPETHIIPPVCAYDPTLSREMDEVRCAPRERAHVSSCWERHYRPRCMCEIVGENNIASVERFERWLHQYGPHSPERMAVVHGPAGSGKTSVVTLIAQALGYEPIQMGSGEQRNRNILQASITEASDSVDLSRFGVCSVDRSRKIIVMEETNSLPSSPTIMQLVQRTKVPLVCITSDCKDPRVKVCKGQTLYCAMSRPSMSGVMAKIRFIAHNEGVAISDARIEDVAASAGMDIRQIVNTLQMIGTSIHSPVPPGGAAAQPAEMGAVFQTSHDIYNSTKDYTCGISEAATRMFDRSVSVAHKFSDYYSEPSMLSLFVQENYLKGGGAVDAGDAAAGGGSARQPALALLRRMRVAADAITQGDVLDRLLHSGDMPHLHHNHALMACVVPAHAMGVGPASVTFPSCLGKQSSMVRRRQTITEMRAHLDRTLMVPFRDMRVGIIPPLRCILSRFVSRERVPDALAFCERYSFSKDDVSLLLETLVLFGAQRVILPPKLRNSLTVQKKGHRLHKAVVA